MTDSKTIDTTTDAMGKDADGFTKIVTQRYMYQAERCKEAKLVGYLLNQIDMPPIERAGVAQPWSAFVIKTTKPTKGVNREDEVVDVEIGAEILIPATVQLTQFLSKAAVNERNVFEVRIIPDKKIDIGKGQTMWQYDLAAKFEQPIPRARFGFAAIVAPPQLLPASTSDNAMPF